MVPKARPYCSLLNFVKINPNGDTNACIINPFGLTLQHQSINTAKVAILIEIIYAFPEISAEWLMRGNGDMIIKAQPNSAELERINKLVDTIATLQETINLKNETIATLSERNKQLEAQLSTK